MWELTANMDVLLYVLWAAVLVISAIIIISSQRRRRSAKCGGQDGDEVGCERQCEYEADDKRQGGDVKDCEKRSHSAKKHSSRHRENRHDGARSCEGLGAVDKAYEEEAALNHDGRISALAYALGGAGNIRSVGCSDTRLRIKVDSGELVDRVKLAATGALGVLAKNRQVQVFYEGSPVSMCRELAAYVRKHGKFDAEDMEVDTEYERVLEKIFTPVEGDIVRLSDICHVQDMGNGGIGGFAVCAKRGEIRAPFDCEAGYREAGKSKIVCSAGSGVCVSFELTHDAVCHVKAESGFCRAGVECGGVSHAKEGHGGFDMGKTRHGSGAPASEDVWHPSHDAGNIRGIRLHFRDGERVRKGRLLAEFFPDGDGDVYCIASVSCPLPVKLVVHPREDVNYEHVACEVVG